MPPTTRPPLGAGRSRAPKIPLYSERECEHCTGLVPGVRRTYTDGRIWIDPGSRRFCTDKCRQAAHRERAAAGLVPTWADRQYARLVREGESIAARVVEVTGEIAELEAELHQLVTRAAEIARLTRDPSGRSAGSC